MTGETSIATGHGKYFTLVCGLHICPLNGFDQTISPNKFFSFTQLVEIFFSFEFLSIVGHREASKSKIPRGLLF